MELLEHKLLSLYPDAAATLISISKDISQYPSYYPEISAAYENQAGFQYQSAPCGWGLPNQMYHQKIQLLLSQSKEIRYLQLIQQYLEMRYIPRRTAEPFADIYNLLRQGHLQEAVTTLSSTQLQLHAAMLMGYQSLLGDNSVEIDVAEWLNQAKVFSQNARYPLLERAVFGVLAGNNDPLRDWLSSARTDQDDAWICCVNGVREGLTGGGAKIYLYQVQQIMSKALKDDTKLITGNFLGYCQDVIADFAALNTENRADRELRAERAARAGGDADAAGAAGIAIARPDRRAVRAVSAEGQELAGQRHNPGADKQLGQPDVNLATPIVFADEYGHQAGGGAVRAVSGLRRRQRAAVQVHGAPIAVKAVLRREVAERGAAVHNCQLRPLPAAVQRAVRIHPVRAALSDSKQHAGGRGGEPARPGGHKQPVPEGDPADVIMRIPAGLPLRLSAARQLHQPVPGNAAERGLQPQGAPRGVQPAERRLPAGHAAGSVQRDPGERQRPERRRDRADLHGSGRGPEGRRAAACPGRPVERRQGLRPDHLHLRHGEGGAQEEGAAAGGGRRPRRPDAAGQDQAGRPHERPGAAGGVDDGAEGEGRHAVPVKK